MKLVAVLLLALLAGCAVSPSCYIGVSLIPPSPFITCGADFAPKEPDEDLSV